MAQHSQESSDLLQVPSARPARERKVSFGVDDKIDDYPIPRVSSIPPPSYNDEYDGYTYGDEGDDESYVDLPSELPPPPDGGWGWVIVIASFFCNMIVDGVAYSFSPYLEEYSEQFDEPKGKVSWVASLLAGVYLSVGPIISAMANKWGCRAVCICGGVISAIAYGCTIFAKNIAYLMVVQGVIVGFGFGMIYLPAVVCVGYYFEQKRAMATGIAVCGSGVGTMLFAPFINYLIGAYGWQGTNIIVAAIILNACWLGALMRPLEVPKMKTKDLKDRLTEVRRASLRRASSSYINVDGHRRQRIDSGGNIDPGVHSHINLVPGGTSFALPTIRESVAGPQANVMEEEEEEDANDTTTEDVNAETNHAAVDGIDDDQQKLVAKPAAAESGHLKMSHLTTGSNMQEKKPTVMPRNMTQPNMGHGPKPLTPRRRSIQKIISVPNFERRMSKTEAMSLVKIIPATSHASHVSLASMDHHARRRSTHTQSTHGNFLDPESAANLKFRRKSSVGRGMNIPVMSRQDIFYAGSIQNLPQFKNSQQDMVSYRESTFNLQATMASESVLEATMHPDQPDAGVDAIPKKTCCPAEFCGPLKQMVDLSLLKNPVFLIIGFANMFGMLGFYTPFVYLPAAAMEKGVSKEQATLLVSIIGITNTIGRVLAGMIADRPWASALWINNVSIGFSALCVFLTPFATNFAGFATIAFFFGFFVSAYISLSSIILVDLLGLEKLTNSFGMLILCRGAASMVGPPIAGSIYDATESYDVSFWCAGVLLFICCALHCTIPFVAKYCKCGKNDDYQCHPNTDYFDRISEEGEEHYGGTSPDAETADRGIILDIKPKLN